MADICGVVPLRFPSSQAITASFGTEFKINVLFFFHREIVIAAENHSFERTHVTTTIHGVDPAP